MSVYTIMSSPVGELVLVGEPAGGGEGDAEFGGERAGVGLELGGGGSEFQRRVWEALDAVPYGTTVTYGEIAARIGAPRAAVRAVGAAIGANPLMIVRPCHRVVGANGALTGYAGGVERKQRLLELEHAG
ncbi:methylated-DNA--[protein]-cysteine S-methyltransferase [Nocardia terpenica]|uniref:methylated-DNA--[protein]-cysteine S-methyltransferase n=1 Tax=Nocardia terpenica TaxID=455432 RepID=A0A164PNM6_9NOCA|nr:methylated-DNA--[protein]-cysteine S-methyltransferase [Nocardia terpenica]KZM75826.1 hypothetical protein AWN90_17855 [Nocardia terpenica]